MTSVIHFHSATDNIGDAAVACSTRDLLHRYLDISAYTSVNVERLKGPTWSLQILLTRIRSAKFINNYDLCVIGGGGLYSKWFFPLNDRLIHLIKTPIILYGIGHNSDFGEEPLSATRTRSIALLNKYARLSSVRDTGTYDFLRSLNVKSMDVIGDPAIFLRTEKPTPNPASEAKLRVGINIAGHRWGLQLYYLNRVIAAYVELCKFLIQDQNSQIIYLKHTTHEDMIINALKKKLPIQVADHLPPNTVTRRIEKRLPNAMIQHEKCYPHKICSVYGSLDLVVGMHMHSAVFAFSNCIPVVNVAYNMKNCYFMNSIHQADKVIRVDRIDVEKLKKKITYTLDNSTEIRRAFRSIKCNIWRKQEKFLREIQSLRV